MPPLTPFFLVARMDSDDVERCLVGRLRGPNFSARRRGEKERLDWQVPKIIY
jgi:hypothetical protein